MCEQSPSPLPLPQIFIYLLRPLLGSSSAATDRVTSMHCSYGQLYGQWAIWAWNLGQGNLLTRHYHLMKIVCLSYVSSLPSSSRAIFTVVSTGGSSCAISGLTWRYIATSRDITLTMAMLAGVGGQHEQLQPSQQQQQQQQRPTGGASNINTKPGARPWPLPWPLPWPRRIKCIVGFCLQ